ncbi:MAG: hypothetical protein O3A87_07555, partial [Verrucomicrobia bacterium]|nr:hypothetical protein [Verrucomicrobiota bacterium]
RSADLTDRPFSFVIKDGDIFQVEKGDALVPVDWTAKESAVFRSWDRVRNDVRALVIAEQDPLVEADELSALRDSLNQSYDAHVFRHGAISAAGKQPPFPRPPVRPNGWLRGLPQKQITSSKRQDRSSWSRAAMQGPLPMFCVGKPKWLRSRRLRSPNPLPPGSDRAGLVPAVVVVSAR